MFDNILVTDDKSFALRYQLFDNSSISDDLPQIFAVDKKGKYLLNYFHLNEDFSEYFKGTKPKFTYTDAYNNLTYVETLCADNFSEKVLDPSFKEFILEIKHEGCPACFLLGKMVDHLSQKLHKHKLLDKLRIFRIDTANDIPLLGEFAATPTYLFIRKNDKNEIEFIAPLDKNEFLFQVKKFSKLNLEKIRYHPNLMIGYQVYHQRKFAEEGYDPDFDIQGFLI